MILNQVLPAAQPGNGANIIGDHHEGGPRQILFLHVGYFLIQTHLETQYLIIGQNWDACKLSD